MPLAAVLLALTSCLALGVGVWSFRALRREAALSRSLPAQIVCAAAFSGWCWLLLTPFVWLALTNHAGYAQTAVIWIEFVYLLVIEAQLLVVWRARPPWGLGVAIVVPLIVGGSLAADRQATPFPTLLLVLQAIVIASAIPVLIVLFPRIGRVR